MSSEIKYTKVIEYHRTGRIDLFVDSTEKVAETCKVSPFTVRKVRNSMGIKPPRQRRRNPVDIDTANKLRSELLQGWRR